MADDKIQEEVSASKELLANQKAFNTLLHQANGYRTASVGDLSKEVNFLRSIGAYAQAEAVHAKNMGKQQQVAVELADKYIKKFATKNKLSSDEIGLIRKAATIEADRLKIVSDYAGMLDKISTKHEKHIEELRSQGKQIRANVQEWAKQKFGLTKEEGLGQAGAGAKTGVKAANMMSKEGGASGAAGDLIGKLGIWGMLIEMMISGFDKVNKAAAGLQSAAGATGEFDKGMQHFVGVATGAELQFSSLSDAFFGQMGMNSTEVLKDAGELAAAGLKISDMLTGNGGMTDSFKKIEGLASATGQSVGAVGKQIAGLINTFRMSKSQAVDAFKGIKDAANAMQETFEATSADLIASITSVADASHSLGQGIAGIGDLFVTLTKTTKGTKFGLQEVNATAAALANIGKADKGWLAFMGVMGGGASGGFLGGLGAAQQRGPGFKGPLASDKELDTGKQIDMLLNAMSKATAGVGDTKGKQLLSEMFSQNFGLTEDQTQLLQKMKSGKLSKAAGTASFKKMEDDAKFNKMGAKGILEKVEELIKKLIFAPLMGIYKALTWANFGKQDIAGLNSNSGGGRDPYHNRRAMGGPVSANMSYLVGERGPELFSPQSNGSITSNRALSSNSGSPLNINISVGMNERDLKGAFDKAHGKTLQLVRKMKQKAN